MTTDYSQRHKKSKHTPNKPAPQSCPVHEDSSDDSDEEATSKVSDIRSCFFWLSLTGDQKKKAKSKGTKASKVAPVVDVSSGDDDDDDSFKVCALSYCFISGRSSTSPAQETHYEGR